MWDNAFTWILGALGLLVSANLLQRKSTRRVAALRARADLVTALAEGPGRDAIREVVDQQATKLAEFLDRESRDWLVKQEPARNVLWSLGASLMLVGVVAAAAAEGPVATVGTVVTLIGGVMLAVGGALGVVFFTVTAARWISADRTS